MRQEGGGGLQRKCVESSPSPLRAIRKTPSLWQSTQVFRLGLAAGHTAVNRQQQQILAHVSLVYS